ncbi:MAG: hypothetical protein ACHQ1H_02285 [Nitrososphaerales archaeon]
MEISLFLMLVLVSSGAVSSVLLTAGYYLPFLVMVALTLVVIFRSERKSKSFSEMLQDKPVY